MTYLNAKLSFPIDSKTKKVFVLFVQFVVPLIWSGDAILTSGSWFPNSWL